MEYKEDEKMEKIPELLNNVMKLSKLSDESVKQLLWVSEGMRLSHQIIDNKLHEEVEK